MPKVQTKNIKSYNTKHQFICKGKCKDTMRPLNRNPKALESMKQYISGLESNCQPRLLYPIQLYFKIDEGNRDILRQDQRKTIHVHQPSNATVSKGILNIEDLKKKVSLTLAQERINSI